LGHFEPALHEVHWRQPQEHIPARSQSHKLQNLQIRRIQQLQEGILVYHITKIHCGQSLDQRFYLGQQGISGFVDCQREANPALGRLFEEGLGYLECLELVGHQHKGEAEKDGPKFELQVFRYFVEVQIVDLHLLITLE
jgi:hypothetical protein